MEMSNQSSYLPIYPYPFSVSSEISSFPASNHLPPTNDYSAYYSNPHPSGIDRSNSRNDCCLVCHDRASGIHFGVVTCEACKAFFRRTSLSVYSIPQPCSPDRCEINIKNRNNCPSCRFDKCKRLGMDRDNAIYGKPSKQQAQPFHQQEHFCQQLTNLCNELSKIFPTIHSINSKQQIETFGHLAFQLFYQQTSPINNSSEIIHRVFHLLFDSSKSHLLGDYHLNLRMLLSLWLFVYYYETFLLRQSIASDKLAILIKLLDMEWSKLQQYYGNEQNRANIFRIDFINTFTKFADLLQEVYADN